MKDLYDERLDEEDLRHHKNMEKIIYGQIGFFLVFFFFGISYFSDVKYDMSSSLSNMRNTSFFINVYYFNSTLVEEYQELFLLKSTLLISHKYVIVGYTSLRWCQLTSRAREKGEHLDFFYDFHRSVVNIRWEFKFWWKSNFWWVEEFDSLLQEWGNLNSTVPHTHTTKRLKFSVLPLIKFFILNSTLW